MSHITHFTRQSPEDGKLTLIGFITRGEDGINLFGIDRLAQISDPDLDQRQVSGELIRFEKPILFDPAKGKNEALWLGGTAQDAVVWLADRNDPLNDPQRQQVWQGAIFAS